MCVLQCLVCVKSGKSCLINHDQCWCSNTHSSLFTCFCVCVCVCVHHIAVYPRSPLTSTLTCGTLRPHESLGGQGAWPGWFGPRKMLILKLKWPASCPTFLLWTLAFKWFDFWSTNWILDHVHDSSPFLTCTYLVLMSNLRCIHTKAKPFLSLIVIIIFLLLLLWLHYYFTHGLGLPLEQPFNPLHAVMLCDTAGPLIAIVCNIMRCYLSFGQECSIKLMQTNCCSAFQRLLLSVQHSSVRRHPSDTSLPFFPSCVPPSVPTRWKANRPFNPRKSSSFSQQTNISV